jgi:hypothetical protein
MDSQAAQTDQQRAAMLKKLDVLLGPQASPAPAAETAGSLDAVIAGAESELGRREGGFSAVDAPMPSTTMQNFGRMAAGMGNQLSAAMQQTSPIVRTAQGEQARQPLGELGEFDIGPAFLGPDGREVAVDPRQHVVLLDEQTGKSMVYPRTPETDQPVGALGRILGVGAMAGPLSGAATRVPSEASRLAQDFKQVGVEPTLAAVSQSRVLGTAEKALPNVIGAGGPIQRRAGQMMEQTAAAAERLADKFGDAAGPYSAGSSVKGGINTYLAEFDRESGRLYRAFDAVVPQDMPVPFDATKAYLAEELGRFADHEKLGEILDSPLLKKVAAALEGENGLPYELLKKLRSEVGRKISRPALVADENRAAMEGLYASLSEDMKGAAAAVDALNPDAQALAKLNAANGHYRQGMELIKGRMEPLAKKAEEAIFADISRMAGERGGANITALRELKDNLPAKDWQNVASAMIRQLGRSTPGASDPLSAANFSSARFVTNFSKMSREAKEVLFSATPDLRRELDALVRVAGAQKNVEKLANVSNSGSHVITLGLAVWFATDPVSAAISAVGGNVAARLMSSPGIVSLLYKTRNMPEGARWAQFLGYAQQRPALARDVVATYVAGQQQGGETIANTPPAGTPTPAAGGSTTAPQ